MAKKHLVTLFQESVAANAERPALMYKRAGSWHTITYAGFGRFVEDLAGGLLALGVEAGDKVAIWSENSPEWVISDYGTLHTGAASVPIYHTLTQDQSAYILKDSDAKVCFVEDAERLEAVLAKRSELPELESIVVMGPVPAGYSGKDDILGMDELYAKGRAHLEANEGALTERIEALTPDTLASLVYTSGTTGNPKGVILTHWNFASNVQATAEVLPFHKELHLGFLPLAHSFARTGDEFYPYSVGSTVAFAEGLEQLTANMAEIQPTVMLSVPRLYEKMYAKIKDGVRQGSPTKQRIFAWAMGVGGEFAHRTADHRPIPATLKVKKSIADALVFKKIHQVTGGRLKFFVSGGAALSKEIQEFFAAAGLWILQGYGLTETSPVLSCNSPENYRFGSVGKPIPGVEIRLDDSEWEGVEGEGEIQCRGPNITEGYFRLEKETRELFTDDGWLKTGDVGRIDEEGFLFITDRKKELFKTAYGKYIAPQVLEGQLKNQDHIAMAVIIGEDKKYVAALIAPDFERLEPWAKAEGIAFESHEDLIANPKVRELIESEVAAVNANLARYEQVKRFELLDRELTQEDGELTPTLKVKRRIIHETYAPQIAACYPDA